MVDVSVLLPVHDGAPFLEEALRSTLSQELDGAIEIVVVNDRMAPPAIACVERFDDPRIRIVPCDGVGLVAALNTGILACKYPLIARIDSDDIMLPGRLTVQAAWMLGHPEVGAMSGQLEWIDEGGATIGYRAYPLEHRRIMRQMRARNAIAHPAAMFRADLARAIGGYRSEFMGAEDYDFWLRFAEVSKLANSPELLLRYRIHGGQVTRSRREIVAESTYLAQWAHRHRKSQSALPWTAQTPPRSLMARIQRCRVRTFSRVGFKADEETNLGRKLGWALAALLVRPGAFVRLVLERRESRQGRHRSANPT